MSEECLKRMSMFGFELPAKSSDDSGEHEKMNKILEQAYNQYEQLKDILWCCLDGGQGEGGEKLSPTDAFHATTTEIHGLLVQCAGLYQYVLARARRLQDELNQERQGRLNAENRATLRERDADAERRLRETRERCEREVSDAEQRLRAEQTRADALEARLQAVEKELLVLRALGRAGGTTSIGTPLRAPAGPSPYLNTATTAPRESSTAVLGTQITSNGGISGFQVGNVSDYVFGTSTVPKTPQTLQWAQDDTADGDLIARRVIFKKEALEDAVKKLTEEKNRLEDDVIKYGRIVDVAKAKLESGGLDSAQLEHLLSVTSGMRGKHEVERLKQEVANYQERLSAEKELHENEVHQLKRKIEMLKKDWQSIFNQICDELNLDMKRYD